MTKFYLQEIRSNDHGCEGICTVLSADPGATITAVAGHTACNCLEDTRQHLFDVLPVGAVIDLGMPVEDAARFTDRVSFSAAGRTAVIPSDLQRTVHR